MLLGGAHVHAGIKFSTRCPSNTWNDFDSYGAFGKMRIGTAVAEGKLKWTPKLLEILYADPLCGACDVGCKRNLDLEIELIPGGIENQSRQRWRGPDARPQEGGPEHCKEPQPVWVTPREQKKMVDR